MLMGIVCINCLLYVEWVNNVLSGKVTMQEKLKQFTSFAKGRGVFMGSAPLPTSLYASLVSSYIGSILC